jgi:hypothetical protein
MSDPIPSECRVCGHTGQSVCEDCQAMGLLPHPSLPEPARPAMPSPGVQPQAACRVCGVSAQTVCEHCRSGIALEALGQIAERTGARYTRTLAERVHQVLADLGYSPGAERLAHILTEALAQASYDLRRGRRITLEHIGHFLLIRPGEGAPVILSRADPQLFSDAVPGRQPALPEEIAHG